LDPKMSCKVLIVLPCNVVACATVLDEPLFFSSLKIRKKMV